MHYYSPRTSSVHWRKPGKSLSNCGFEELCISLTECLCKILNISLHFFTHQNTDLITAHTDIQNKRPLGLEERGFHRQKAAKNSTHWRPLELLLTNYPRVSICYVTKGEVCQIVAKLSSAAYGMFLPALMQLTARKVLRQAELGSYNKSSI